MKKYVKALPDWATRLLKGLSFWVAYKKTVYPHYPLREAALVAEGTGLLYFDKSIFKVDCEIMYKELEGLSNLEVSHLKEFGDKRVDILISQKLKKQKDDSLIEIKRFMNDSSTEYALIESDVDKLAKYLEFSKNKKARCFVLIVSQNDAPRKYLNKSGGAKKVQSKQEVFQTEAGNKFRVRRVCFATSSIQDLKKVALESSEDKVSTVFSILLEVFI